MASPRGATAPKNGLQSQKGIVSVPHKYSKYRAVTRPTPWHHHDEGTTNSEHRFLLIFPLQASAFQQIDAQQHSTVICW